MMQLRHPRTLSLSALRTPAWTDSVQALACVRRASTTNRREFDKSADFSFGEAIALSRAEVSFMNRTIFSLLSILPMAGTLIASAQAPPALPAAPQANSIIENSRISRYVAGSGDRPRGLLLRDGTFVNFPPGLSQQLPGSLPKNGSVRVSGNVLMYDGSRTIRGAYHYDRGCCL
jgi:hypothetical protein